MDQGRVGNVGEQSACQVLFAEPAWRKQIEKETENWERVAATMARFLAPSN